MTVPDCKMQIHPAIDQFVEDQLISGLNLNMLMIQIASSVNLIQFECSHGRITTVSEDGMAKPNRWREKAKKSSKPRKTRGRRAIVGMKLSAPSQRTRQYRRCLFPRGSR
jgi:hypothetical protein